MILQIVSSAINSKKILKACYFYAIIIILIIVQCF